VAEQRTQDAVKQAQTAAERDRRTSLDDRLKHLLGTIPPEVQDEGLSIVELQVMLRPRGCTDRGPDWALAPERTEARAPVTPSPLAHEP
jgi:hypothetical protein